MYVCNNDNTMSCRQLTMNYCVVLLELRNNVTLNSVYNNILVKINYEISNDYH